MEYVFSFLDSIVANIIILVAPYHQSNGFRLNNEYPSNLVQIIQEELHIIEYPMFKYPTTTRKA